MCSKPACKHPKTEGDEVQCRIIEKKERKEKEKEEKRRKIDEDRKKGIIHVVKEEEEEEEREMEECKGLTILRNPILIPRKITGYCPRHSQPASSHQQRWQDSLLKNDLDFQTYKRETLEGKNHISEGNQSKDQAGEDLWRRQLETEVPKKRKKEKKEEEEKKKKEVREKKKEEKEEKKREKREEKELKKAKKEEESGKKAKKEGESGKRANTCSTM